MYRDIKDDQFIFYYCLIQTELNDTLESIQELSNTKTLSKGPILIKTLSLTTSSGENFKLRFQNSQDEKTWLMYLREKINQLNTHTNINITGSMKNIYNKKLTKVLLTFSLTLNRFYIHLVDNKGNEVIRVYYEKFNLNLTYRKKDIKLEYSLCNVQAENLSNDSNSNLKVFLNKLQTKSNSNYNENNTPICTASILLCEKASPYYKNERFSCDINFESTVLYLDPVIITTLCDYFTPNNEFKRLDTFEIVKNALSEQEKLTNEFDSMIFNSNEEINAAVRCSLKEIKIIFVSKNNCMFSELSIGKSQFESQLYKEYIVTEGSIGNFRVLELSNYPFTIKSNSEFSVRNVKELIGFDDDVSISFNIKKKHVCIVKEDYCCNFVINSLMVNYVHEPYLRIINFIIYILTELKAVDITKSIERYLTKTHDTFQFYDFKVKFN